MKARALAVLLLLAAPLVAGEPPETDPFLAALAGKSGPDAVAAPTFDPWVEAMTWSLRPRREIVDALAACLLRGEAPPSPPAKPHAPWPAPPARVSEHVDPVKIPVTDRLAAWVPADAAAAFFESKADAEQYVERLAIALSRSLPRICGDAPGSSREALRRATRRLLLPSIWGSNPQARTGLRQVAIVASDPDLRWAPDVAFIAEVEDASLVRFHRQASLRWEERGLGPLRVEGLDAWSDDGSVRSFFALEGGVAIWSTTRTLRDRILAAGAGKTPSLLGPDPRAYAQARRTFPASEGGAVLVVPDGFVARADSREFRTRRAATLRCEASRLLLDARSLAGEDVSQVDTYRCPCGGVLRPIARTAGASCSIHGTAADPTPEGDLPEAAPAGPMPGEDAIRGGGLPVAVRCSPGAEEFPGRFAPPGFPRVEILVPPGEGGRRLLEALDPWEFEPRFIQPSRRTQPLATLLGSASRADAALERLEGIRGLRGDDLTVRHPSCKAFPAFRPAGGLLLLEFWAGSRAVPGQGGGAPDRLLLEWR